MNIKPVILIGVGILSVLTAAHAALPPCNSFEFNQPCGDPYPPAPPTCVALYCWDTTSWWCGPGPLGSPVYDCEDMGANDTGCVYIMYEYDVAGSECVGDGTIIGDGPGAACSFTSSSDCVSE